MDNLSEKDKMIKQMNYNALDPELLKLRVDAEKLFQEYNNLLKMIKKRKKKYLINYSVVGAMGS